MTSVLLTAFANCGTYSDDGLTSSANSLSVTCDDDCITPVTDNLVVKIKTADNGASVPVAAITDFNIGGDCNEGGFPYNTMIWELYSNGVKVRDSNMPGTGGTGNANGSCKNGRFMLYVYLGPISGDNVDRTALRNGSNYTLTVELYGQSVAYGPAQRNQLTARRTINLNSVN